MLSKVKSAILRGEIGTQNFSNKKEIMMKLPMKSVILYRTQACPKHAYILFLLLKE